VLLCKQLALPRSQRKRPHTLPTPLLVLPELACAHAWGETVSLGGV